mmetsp:Transcript_11374/g.48530  ORF Transcript_11374/g.48530 Transcript_11374/m.48530 type:complete len:226 (+) Transcript_11374:66-743(+)
MSKFTTCVTPLMSKPRAATSVANIKGHSLSTNFFNADSRSFCCLSPCTLTVPNPKFQNVLESISTRRFVLAKATTRAPGDNELNKSYMCLCFSSSWALMKRCVTALFALSSPASAPSPPPRKTRVAACFFFLSDASSSFASSRASPESPRLAPSARNAPASLRTDLGHVAVKSVVWRPAPTFSCSAGAAGTAANTSRSCGSKPMSSMRSASSRVTTKHAFKMTAF